MGMTWLGCFGCGMVLCLCVVVFCRGELQRSAGLESLRGIGNRKDKHK